jgi:hypothetical protein
MAKKTAWFAMPVKPIRFGEYEGKEKRTGCVMPVFWRKLQDESKPGWYFYKGVFGPFNMWESAESKMSGWRGLALPPAPTEASRGDENP